MINDVHGVVLCRQKEAKRSMFFFVFLFDKKAEKVHHELELIFFFFAEMNKWVVKVG